MRSERRFHSAPVTVPSLTTAASSTAAKPLTNESGSVTRGWLLRRPRRLLLAAADSLPRDPKGNPVTSIPPYAVGHLPDSMVGVVLTGYGGFECLEYRDDLPVPRPGVGEVLINVHAAGMNNTDINTRTGWYHKGIASGTTAEGGADGLDVAEQGMGAWAGDVVFPRIQGADVSGHIVATGLHVDSRRVGERVVCDPYCRAEGDATGIASAEFLGAERDGGFAQFCLVPAVNAHPVPDIAIDDAKLATLPCSAGTAMNMLLIARVGPGDRVIVTGGSGGVGTFLIQIARHLGAEVAAIASVDKHGPLAALGANVVDRACPDPIGAARDILGAPPTVIADVVGGEGFGFSH